MKNLKLALSVIGIVSLAACSSGPKKVDTDIDAKGNSTDGVIGIKNDKVVIQKETSEQDELRQVQWGNSKTEDDMNRELFNLKRCREDMADERLGGSGEVTPIPDVDNMKQISDVKEEFGLTKSGNLSFVTQEDYLKRIQIERNYQTSLKGMYKTVVSQKEDCERKMGKARVKAGLPAKRYQGKGVINANGNLTDMVDPNETNLDDAFKILAAKKAKPAGN